MALSSREKLALRVAQLRAQNLGQKAVAGLLGTDQPDVSRLEKLAKKQGWLSQQMVAHWPDKISTAERREIEAAVSRRRDVLWERFHALAEARRGIAPTAVHVVYSPAESTPTDFGRMAAQSVAQLIGQSSSCAVAWGKTLSSVVNAIRAGDHGARRRMTFLPISGQPLNSHEPGFSPSMLSDTLADAYEARRLSLHGVPARIPKDMFKQATLIREFVSHCRHYNEIFGSERDPARTALMSNVDMILSGIGNAESSKADPWYLDVAQMEGGIELDRISAGNIGGVWLPIEAATKDQRRAVDEINARWLGINEDHFRSCAKRTAGPGVVVVAREKAKIGILLRTVGMVNHYVLSGDLVDAAMQAFDAKRPGDRVRKR